MNLSIVVFDQMVEELIPNDLLSLDNLLILVLFCDELLLGITHTTFFAIVSLHMLPKVNFESILVRVSQALKLKQLIICLSSLHSW